MMVGQRGQQVGHRGMADLPQPGHAQVLGPVPVAPGPGVSAETQERALIRTARQDGLALARALHAAQATRSARKEGGAVRIQLDPAEVA